VDVLSLSGEKYAREPKGRQEARRKTASEEAPVLEPVGFLARFTGSTAYSRTRDAAARGVRRRRRGEEEDAEATDRKHPTGNGGRGSERRRRARINLLAADVVTRNRRAWRVVSVFLELTYH